MKNKTKLTFKILIFFLFLITVSITLSACARKISIVGDLYLFISNDYSYNQIQTQQEMINFGTPETKGDLHFKVKYDILEKILYNKENQTQARFEKIQVNLLNLAKIQRANDKIKNEEKRKKEINKYKKTIEFKDTKKDTEYVITRKDINSVNATYIEIKAIITPYKTTSFAATSNELEFDASLIDLEFTGLSDPKLQAENDKEIVERLKIINKFGGNNAYRENSHGRVVFKKYHPFYRKYNLTEAEILYQKDKKDNARLVKENDIITIYGNESNDEKELKKYFSLLYVSFEKSIKDENKKPIRSISDSDFELLTNLNIKTSVKGVKPELLVDKEYYDGDTIVFNFSKVRKERTTKVVGLNINGKDYKLKETDDLEYVVSNKDENGINITILKEDKQETKVLFNDKKINENDNFIIKNHYDLDGNTVLPDSNGVRRFFDGDKFTLELRDINRGERLESLKRNGGQLLTDKNKKIGNFSKDFTVGISDLNFKLEIKTLNKINLIFKTNDNYISVFNLSDPISVESFENIEVYPYDEVLIKINNIPAGSSFNNLEINLNDGSDLINIYENNYLFIIPNTKKEINLTCKTVLKDECYEVVLDDFYRGTDKECLINGFENQNFFKKDSLIAISTSSPKYRYKYLIINGNKKEYNEDKITLKLDQKLEIKIEENSVEEIAFDIFINLSPEPGLENLFKSDNVKAGIQTLKKGDKISFQINNNLMPKNIIWVKKAIIRDKTNNIISDDLYKKIVKILNVGNKIEILITSDISSITLDETCYIKKSFLKIEIEDNLKITDFLENIDDNKIFKSDEKNYYFYFDKDEKVEFKLKKEIIALSYNFNNSLIKLPENTDKKFEIKIENNSVLIFNLNSFKVKK